MSRIKTTHLKEAQTTNQPPGSTVVMPRLWDQKQLAAYLGKKEGWAERARWEGKGPVFIKLGRHVRYKAEDVFDWIEENARTCTREGAPTLVPDTDKREDVSSVSADDF